MFWSRWRRVLTVSLITFFTSVLNWGCSDRSIDHESLERLYDEQPHSGSPPTRVYHLGHSLVGPDMPFMLAQLADGHHDYKTQVGWGTYLQQHWEQGDQVPGLNLGAPDFVSMEEAIGGNDFDAYVMTEAVEIKDALKWHDPPGYLSKIVATINKNNPGARVYFYETWHHVNDPNGWLNRLENDFQEFWMDQILYAAVHDLDYSVPIYVIPAGQAFLNFFRELPHQTDFPGDIEHRFFFSDDIHLNDIGNYFVALVHYAVLYGRSPVGLPYALQKPDGSAAAAPSEEIARFMQEIVWQTVVSNKKTGVSPSPD
jgi:hypothetical protein